MKVTTESFRFLELLCLSDILQCKQRGLDLQVRASSIRSRLGSFATVQVRASSTDD